MYTALRNIAYPNFVFNRHAWALGVNMLTMKHITPFSLLYLCKYIRHVAPLSKAVEEVVVDMFHESLTDYIQRSDSGEPAKELGQVLYQALRNRGNISSIDVATLDSLTPDIPTNNYKSHILGLIYDNA